MADTERTQAPLVSGEATAKATPEGDASATASPAELEHRPIAVGVDAVLIELPEFEGPLDLLLHLIQKEELDIINVPIARITDRYLSYLRLMQSLNIDIAGEYLLMAATLAYLKSRELVPQPEEPEETAEEEEVGDARQLLIRRLLEYQKYKEAAGFLGSRPVMGRNIWPRGSSPEHAAGLSQPQSETLEPIAVFRLIEALEQVLGRARIKLTHDVVVERISITDKINELVDRLAAEPAFTFSSCFQFVEAPMALEELRHRIVITFMAVLEMTRLRMIRLHQASDRSEIYVARASAVDDDGDSAAGERDAVPSLAAAAMGDEELHEP